jgi:hypothetical protein
MGDYDILSSVFGNDDCANKQADDRSKHGLRPEHELADRGGRRIVPELSRCRSDLHGLCSKVVVPDEHTHVTEADLAVIERTAAQLHPKHHEWVAQKPEPVLDIAQALGAHAEYTTKIINQLQSVENRDTARAARFVLRERLYQVLKLIPNDAEIALERYVARLDRFGLRCVQSSVVTQDAFQADQCNYGRIGFRMFIRDLNALLPLHRMADMFYIALCELPDDKQCTVYVPSITFESGVYQRPAFPFGVPVQAVLAYSPLHQAFLFQIITFLQGIKGNCRESEYPPTIPV